MQRSILPTAAASFLRRVLEYDGKHNSAGTWVEQELSPTTPGMGSI